MPLTLKALVSKISAWLMNWGISAWMGIRSIFLSKVLNMLLAVDLDLPIPLSEKRIILPHV